MKAIILAAGQGVRLRPLTNDRPKCMVRLLGKSMPERQLAVMRKCGVREEEITVITGYQSLFLRRYFVNTGISFVENRDYESTNMVYSLMCAKNILEAEKELLISYGDIIYRSEVLSKVLSGDKNASVNVAVDDGWYDYWSKRCADPLEDAETLVLDGEDNIVEIGGKTDKLSNVQAQYIGLMRFGRPGLDSMLRLCLEAEKTIPAGDNIWGTERPYRKIYMTDLLQKMADNGDTLKAAHIDRGWYEVDCAEDLRLAESELKKDDCISEYE